MNNGAARKPNSVSYFTSHPLGSQNGHASQTRESRLQPLIRKRDEVRKRRACQRVREFTRFYNRRVTSPVVWLFFLRISDYG